MGVNLHHRISGRRRNEPLPAHCGLDPPHTSRASLFRTKKPEDLGVMLTGWGGFDTWRNDLARAGGQAGDGGGISNGMANPACLLRGKVGRYVKENPVLPWWAATARRCSLEGWQRLCWHSAPACASVLSEVWREVWRQRSGASHCQRPGWHFLKGEKKVRLVLRERLSWVRSVSAP